MDLSKITAKINSKLALTKAIDVQGVAFVIKVPNFEHQAILDEITNTMDVAPETGQGEELARRVVAYALLSVDGEPVGGDTIAVTEEVRKWPAYLVNTLGAAAINFRLEMAAKAALETTFEWFDIKEFKLKKDEVAAKAEAKAHIQEKSAARTLEEAAAADSIEGSEEQSSFIAPQG